MLKLMKLISNKTCMKGRNFFVFFLVSTLLLTITLSFSLSSVQAQSERFKISGYVLDSNGHGIAKADVIFNVPSIVPGVYTDNSGYYETSGPSGTYHINVWPPYDSNYINYDEPGFVVASDVTKNITLYTGYKVSGYISDLSGIPVTGAVVFLNGYGSGWFSTSNGYYFLAVPAGTYKIDAHPRIGTYQGPTTSFPTYYEYNFAVKGNTVKNITVGNPAPTPTPTSTPSPTPTPDTTRFKISGYVKDLNGAGIAKANVIFNVPSIVPSVWTDNSGYYEMFAPSGTYHINVWPPFDSNYINYDQSQFVVASEITKNITLYTGCKVSGYISDYSGTPMTGAAILFNNYGSGWFSNNSGYYFLNVPAGTYTINAHPRTGYNYQGPTSNFPTYYEYNFTVSGNTIKNITVGNPTANPTPTPTITPTTNPTSAPTGTPTITEQPTITSAYVPTLPVQAFALSPAEVQPPQNMLLLLLIVIVSAIAVISLVRIFGSEKKLATTL